VEISCEHGIEPNTQLKGTYPELHYFDTPELRASGVLNKTLSNSLECRTGELSNERYLELHYYDALELQDSKDITTTHSKSPER
jgi:hypothetical protein